VKDCSVANCDVPARRWGFCPSHAGRFYRHGDPLAGTTPRKPRGLSEEDAFAWYMPGPPPDDGCWDWTGGTLKSYGYGVVAFGGTQHRAHVVSYHIHCGETHGLYVLHSCDRPICVQPKHLNLGSQAKNMAEMVERDRHSRGERNGHAKLTEDDVRAIRESPLPQRTLGEMFGINQATVSQIRTGKRWKHVE